MPMLHEWQRGFAAAVLEGGRYEDELLRSSGLPLALARLRLAVYRRSAIGNLTAALQSCYPVVLRIVGPSFFREAARQYIVAYPSRSGDLNEFGDAFADFLQTYNYARGLPYLPDVARLEWLVQQVYYAADVAALDLGHIAHAAPADYERLRFVPAPGQARLDSVWPVAQIWQANHAEEQDDMPIDFSCACHALVSRRAGRVGVAALAAGDASLFDALAAGIPLGAAVQRALAVDAGLDLAEALRRFVADGLFERIVGDAE